MDNNSSIVFSVLNYHGQLNSVLGGFVITIIIIFTIFVIKNKYSKALLFLFVLVVLPSSIRNDMNSIKKYFKFRNIYTSEKYKEVTGTIKDYNVFMTQGVCSHEDFVVNDVEFQYNSCRITGGLNESKVIKDGVRVKIRYINEDSIDKYGNGYKKIILYLERLSRS